MVMEMVGGRLDGNDGWDSSVIQEAFAALRATLKSVSGLLKNCPFYLLTTCLHLCYLPV